MVRRFVLAALLAAGILLVPTAAAAATADKASVLADWTQPTTSSWNAWNGARLNRAPWQSYNFDWSTDYCSASPDNPLGFNFTLPCWHHDFGYRNFKDIGTFPANKARVDDTFYTDLRRVCATYSTLVRPACYSLAWTYYEAVHVFGSLAWVTQADIKRAEAQIR
ncbi:phospholipase [Paractinoplanes ferrugineus]|uniref:Phospholipase n=1 Tax=Paractinoplanes ferrugineus TaxID=113564 RepID=A0A919IUW1_9ACTN|nr:phospholipase [Actinoplanes ferrugineus]GIE08487.1 hypothetical protein Afe05nite_03270 [Actinoplanes ferrugineus]